MGKVSSYTQQIWKSKFARSVGLVASGTAGAQIITVTFSPLITRIYGPEAFGALGTFNALLMVLIPIATLSYPMAIVLPEEDNDARALVRISLKIALFNSLLTAVLLFIFTDWVVATFNVESVGSFLMLLPVAMFLSGLMAVFMQWVIRNKLFFLQAKVSIAHALCLNGLKAGLGLIIPSAAVLVSVTAFGNGLNALLFYFGIKKHGHTDYGRSSAEVSSKDSKQSEVSLARQHGDFAIYRTPQIVLNAASQSMPVLMLAAFFGPAIAGFYTIGKTVLGLPTALIGQSVSAVFYPHFNEVILAGRSGAALLLKATGALAVIGIVPFGLVILFGPFLFELIFGDGWETAGFYAQWLALWSYFGFINRPSVAAIPVLKLQGNFLIFEIVSVITRAAALYAGYQLFGTAIASIIAFSLASAALNTILISLAITKSRKMERVGTS